MSEQEELKSATAVMPKFKHSFAVNVIDTSKVTPDWLRDSGGNPDKLQVTEKYGDQLKQCRFYHNFDPIAAGVINKQVELAFNDYKPLRGDASDKEYAVYRSIDEVILEILKRAAEEYLVSGLVVPSIEWDRIKGKEIGVKGNANKTFMLPKSVWLREPEILNLKRTPVPTNVRVFITVPSDEVYFITNEGKYEDGTEDKELYKQLKRAAPEYVKKIQAGDTEIWLEDAFVIRRNVKPGQLFPVPYLLPALESLTHKRNLRKMDYAVAARVISAIQLVTMGSDAFPLTEDDVDVLDDLQAQMRWREKANNIERVFQLFGNHTLDIKWIYPDTKTLLDESKYASVNRDILYALGIPSIVTIGETERSATSQAEFALLPPIEVLRHLRHKLLPLVKYIYAEIKKRNKFKGMAIPSLGPVKLYDLNKMGELGKNLHDAGIISKSTLASWVGLDFDYELEQRKREIDKMKEMGIDETPAVPFDSPNQGKIEGNPPQKPPETPN